jgi:ornithine cyclodeaminase/alanine dehydrogenase
MHTEDGGFHIKTGVLELHRSYFAAKVNGNFPENGSRFGLPTIQGVIVLCDARNGTPLAVMDSRDITALRTAAATAVAAKFLAREDSRTATICGCGNQGRIQLRALLLVRHLQDVFAYDKDEEKALRFARELASDLKISVRPTADLSAAVRQSDICVTCTPSRQPLLGPNDVSLGTSLLPSAQTPVKQELHPSLSVEKQGCGSIPRTVRAMMGFASRIDACQPQANVHAELGEAVAGEKAGTSWKKLLFRQYRMALRRQRPRLIQADNRGVLVKFRGLKGQNHACDQARWCFKDSEKLSRWFVTIAFLCSGTRSRAGRRFLLRYGAASNWKRSRLPWAVGPTAGDVIQFGL